ncbi:MAG: hypothetical protein A3J54_02165 [Candidatus Ryanbacteria bacterium RIFCSPHIGHO2_02_FULL_45_13b]|uniref:FtsK domain-containing protein n=1 Tax=Candidatus Ryanbacteria bacterium RIFCSPHIGHO2_02_FULL_45_13b TaxID=1802117 RepID=A0A1G2G7P6_9BACT|nr:MAG: hypothetical protein A3J54_02165 [Candidatus Ryanbacteria bacterium RIFCSPHIGHO2_02_FULL_45_13b]
MFWGNKKQKKKKTNGEKEEGGKWHDDLNPETKQSVWAVLSFGAATLLLLAWFGNAGRAGEGLSTFFRFLFGKAFLVIPVALLLAGISFLFGMRRRIFGGTFLGAFLFLAGMLGLGEIFGGSQTSGYVGFGIAFLPLRFFDRTASIVLFGAILIISLLLMFNRALVPQRKEKEEENIDETSPREDQNPKKSFWKQFLTFFSVFGGKKQESVFVVNTMPESPDQQLPVENPTPPSPAQSAPEPLDQNQDTKAYKPLVSRRQIATNYKPPSIDMLEPDKGKPSSGDVRANANIIQRTLQSFGIDVDMGEVNIGPSVTQYTLKPAEGVKLSRITNLTSNLGLALAAHPLRMEAPIPGRSLIGIEVPNKSIAFVGLRSLLTELDERKKEFQLGFSLGRDVTGQAVFADLARMPHVLVAGSTGSGKSVTIHSLLMGLLFFNPPEFLKLIMVDPKRVELTHYNGIPHLMSPVITDPKKAIQALRWAVSEMDKRYTQLEAAGARDIASYNTDATNEDIMPYLVIVVDELADLMTTYPREVEASIVRIAQMARAVGIHLVISTQRPSVDVITGLIKANVPARIALQTVSQIDSRTILDMAGAEKLLGKGDMLYIPADAAKPRRIQGVYVSDGEVKRVVRYLAHMSEGQEDVITPSENIFANAPVSFNGSFDEDDTDNEIYEEARHLVIETGKASTSFLQRRLRLGYARAARLMDVLEERGVVGPADGAKPRDILVSRETSAPLGAEEVHES